LSRAWANWPPGLCRNGLARHGLARHGLVLRLLPAELADCLMRHAILRQPYLSWADRSLATVVNLPGSRLAHARAHTAGLLQAGLRW
jgi:hypothetical protein